MISNISVKNLYEILIYCQENIKREVGTMGKKEGNQGGKDDKEKWYYALSYEDVPRRPII